MLSFFFSLILLFGSRDCFIASPHHMKSILKYEEFKDHLKAAKLKEAAADSVKNYIKLLNEADLVDEHAKNAHYLMEALETYPNSVVDTSIDKEDNADHHTESMNRHDFRTPPKNFKPHQSDEQSKDIELYRLMMLHKMLMDDKNLPPSSQKHEGQMFDNRKSGLDEMEVEDEDVDLPNSYHFRAPDRLISIPKL